MNSKRGRRSITSARGATAALVALLAIAPALEAQSGGSEPEEAVVATVEALFAATEAGDLAALDTLYADDVTIVEGTNVDRGWATYRDGHLKPELERIENLTYRPREIEAEAGEALAWARFAYDLKLTIDGRELDHVGRGTAVLESAGDGWVVTHLHTVSEPRE